MHGRFRYLAFACSLFVVGMQPAAAQDAAPANVMFIFDASGSMRASIGKERRIDAAKRAFAETMKTMPASARLGLITFGHRKPRECRDLEVVSPVGADTPAALAEIVGGFQALGETPIAAAIDRAGEAMRAFEGQANSIVLLTDGIEECGGDPCAAAKRLVDAGLQVKVHVVGFALGAGQGDKLQCITQLTGGTYHDATDAKKLTSALEQVRQRVVQVAPPAPPKAPERKVIFQEQFTGSDLSRDNWEVLNENKDFYIVENGELMMVGPQAAAFSNPKTMNILRLIQDLPNSNWDIVIDAKVQTQTGSDNFLAGLYTDDKSFLGVSLVRDAGSHHTLRIARVTGEQTTASQVLLSTSRSYDYPPWGFTEDQGMIGKALGEKGIRLVISKRERRYVAAAEIRDWKDKNNKERRVVTQEVTSLRVPGRLVLAVGKVDGKRPGETIAFIEKIEIVAVE